jgi:hypothetical protein
VLSLLHVDDLFHTLRLNHNEVFRRQIHSVTQIGSYPVAKSVTT